MINNIQVFERKNCGKSATRILRKKNKIPAIIYGKSKLTIHISIDEKNFMYKKNELSFFNKEYFLILKKKKIKVKIHQIQHHPFKLKVSHIDFLEIN